MIGAIARGAGTHNTQGISDHLPVALTFGVCRAPAETRGSRIPAWIAADPSFVCHFESRWYACAPSLLGLSSYTILERFKESLFQAAKDVCAEHKGARARYTDATAELGAVVKALCLSNAP